MSDQTKPRLTTNPWRPLWLSPDVDENAVTVVVKLAMSAVARRTYFYMGGDFGGISSIYNSIEIKKSQVRAFASFLECVRDPVAGQEAEQLSSCWPNRQVRWKERKIKYNWL